MSVTVCMYILELNVFPILQATINSNTRITMTCVSILPSNIVPQFQLQAIEFIDFHTFFIAHRALPYNK